MFQYTYGKLQCNDLKDAAKQSILSVIAIKGENSIPFCKWKCIYFWFLNSDGDFAENATFLGIHKKVLSINNDDIQMYFGSDTTNFSRDIFNLSWTVHITF